MIIGSFTKSRFESNKQEYETPDDLFKAINEEFNFTIDICADEHNKKVANYYCESDDALTKNWQGVCWMNPPYVEVGKWVKKAYEESRKDDCVVVCLIPARTNTKWWHTYCMKSEVRFICGRPKFGNGKTGLPLPLAVVIMGRDYIGNYKSVII